MFGCSDVCSDVCVCSVVRGSVSGKTSYLLKGDLEAGESKTAKAESLGVKVINEDGLFDLIKSRSPEPEKLKKTKKPTKAEQKSTDSFAAVWNCFRRAWLRLYCPV